MKKHDAPGGDWIRCSVELYVKKDEEIYKLAEQLSQKTGNSIEDELNFALMLGCNPHIMRNLQFQLCRCKEA